MKWTIKQQEIDLNAKTMIIIIIKKKTIKEKTFCCLLAERRLREQRRSNEFYSSIELIKPNVKVLSLVS
jgi:hypothetical protein